MAITFNRPSTAGAKHGPGFVWDVTSSLIGPMPTGSYWEVGIQNVAGTWTSWNSVVPWVSASQVGIMGIGRVVPGDILHTHLFISSAGLTNDLETGDTGTLFVRLHNGSTGAIDDSGTLSITVDNVDGASQLFAFVSASLTSDVSLAAILAAVRPTYHSPL
jgi:hypothetical protein